MPIVVVVLADDVQVKWRHFTCIRPHLPSTNSGTARRPRLMITLSFSLFLSLSLSFSLFLSLSLSFSLSLSLSLSFSLFLFLSFSFSLFLSLFLSLSFLSLFSFLFSLFSFLFLSFLSLSLSHSLGADGAWLGVVVGLCLDALILSLSVLAGGSGIRGTRMGSRPKNLFLERAQLLDILPLHVGQDLLGFRFHDVLDLELPHAVPQLEVGPLAGQLVTRDLARRNHRSRCTVVDAVHQDTRRPGLEAVQFCLLLDGNQEEAAQRRLASRARVSHRGWRVTLHSRQALLVLWTVLGNGSLVVAAPADLLPLPSLPLPSGLRFASL